MSHAAVVRGLAWSTPALAVTGAQTVTIDFRRDVTDAEFTLAGFDWVQDGDERGVKDTVTVTPAPTGTVPAGVTPGNPFTAASEGTGRSVVVAIAGPVSGLTLQLSNPVGPDAPGVIVQDLSFTANAAG